MSFSTFFKNFLAPRKRVIGATDLQRALTNNEFVFYYQPEWDLKTGKIKGLEALMRWESPNGIIPPNDFIPVLEETGLISKFTPFLLEQTLHDLREIHSVGFSDLFMSVNFSAVQLRDPSLPQLIQQVLDKYEMTPEYLECEITETTSFGADGIELEILKKLKRNGIKVSVDDFGSGHASFNYLKDLEPHKLKVDRDFISTLFDRPANQIIMRTIIDLGHSLGLIVLAEGIETPEQEKWLAKNKCDYGQGFLFSRPLPLSMLIPFMRSRTTVKKSKKNG